MAFRGRGRGRGFGRGDFRFAKQESFVLFPDIELPDKRNVAKDMKVIQYNNKFRRYFKNSPYYLEDNLTDEQDGGDIERYSDRAKSGNRFGRGSLLDSGFLILEHGYFPLELVQGRRHKVRRKVQWNPKHDLQKMDLLEQLELKEKHGDQGMDNKEKEAGGGDEEEEEEDNGAETEEYSDEGDYEENRGYDDDEDDYNMSDGGEEEPTM